MIILKSHRQVENCRSRDGITNSAGEKREWSAQTKVLLNELLSKRFLELQKRWKKHTNQIKKLWSVHSHIRFCDSGTSEQNDKNNSQKCLSTCRWC